MYQIGEIFLLIINQLAPSLWTSTNFHWANDFVTAPSIVWVDSVATVAAFVFIFFITYFRPLIQQLLGIVAVTLLPLQMTVLSIFV